MIGRLTRRTFLSVLAALGLVPGARSASAAGGRDVLGPPQTEAPAPQVTLDEFVALSERITGHRALDRTTAGVYLDAWLRSPADRVVLADLVSHARTASVTTPAHAAMEARILESWYTGEHPVGGTAQVATYAGALMWTVLGRLAPGSCAGEAGHWSSPPETKS